MDEKEPVEKAEADARNAAGAEEPKADEPKAEKPKAEKPKADKYKAEERPDYLAEMERVESEERLDDEEFLRERKERHERWKREEARRRKRNLYAAIGGVCGVCALLGVVCGLIVYFRSPFVKTMVLEAGGGTFGGGFSDGERVRHGCGICDGYVGLLF